VQLAVDTGIIGLFEVLLKGLDKSFQFRKGEK
jgi:hypothetical protein